MSYGNQLYTLHEERKYQWKEELEYSMFMTSDIHFIFTQWFCSHSTLFIVHIMHSNLIISKQCTLWWYQFALSAYGYLYFIPICYKAICIHPKVEK